MKEQTLEQQEVIIPRTKLEITQTGMRWLTDKAREIRCNKKDDWGFSDWLGYVVHHILESATDGNSSVKIDFSWNKPTEEHKKTIVDHLKQVGMSVSTYETALWIEW